MDNFIVSARKYRPTTFDTVVGQESITSTLKNAIKTNHLSQSYLFCGPRGVGKTTCARILAKTINCLNLDESIEACDECESCLSFNTSRSFNIHELDAASNNKVDDIRTLTELVRIPPQIGKYSIYIIDEVHMLSTSAFNAFLKTLEEPPSHAIFILATTEKQKIIPTILSRCQIFDFSRITIDDIVGRLQFVAGKESIETEQEALHVIAQKADGAMRDALSIFDQIVSFSGKSISYHDVIDNLNVLDFEYYLKITKSFINSDVSSSLIIFNEILEKGFDGHNFIAGLASHLRNLLVCKNEQTAILLEVGSTIRSRYIDQTKEVPVNFIYRSLDILSSCDINYKLSRNPRLHVEIALVKLSTLIEKRIETLPESNEVKSPISKPLSKVSPDKTDEKETTLQENPTVSVKVSDDNPANKDNPVSYASQSKGFSIKDQLKKSTKGSDLVEDSDQNLTNGEDVISSDAVFDIKELHAVWKKFGDTVKEKSTRMAGIINGMEPELKADNSIELILSTDAQKEYFDKNYKSDMLGFLKKELNNNQITFATVVSDLQENNTPYTQEEKFNHLKSKNPDLEIMKKDLGLDFE